MFGWLKRWLWGERCGICQTKLGKTHDELWYRTADEPEPQLMLVCQSCMKSLEDEHNKTKTQLAETRKSV